MAGQGEKMPGIERGLIALLNSPPQSSRAGSDPRGRLSTHPAVFESASSMHAHRLQGAPLVPLRPVLWIRAPNTGHQYGPPTRVLPT